MRDIRDFDILNLPGWDNSGPDHWQTHWEKAFSNMRRVEQADWQHPRFADWSRQLSLVVKACRRPVLLVAHSLGTSLVMRWADEEYSRTIAGAFLVAPTDRDLREGDPEDPGRDFGPMLTDPLPFPSMVLASQDDEFVSLERARHFAECWESSFVNVGALGHIGSAARLGLWPQGLVWLGQFLASLGAVGR
jgi:predicted alpha/beta hydrolase family esterase